MFPAHAVRGMLCVCKNQPAASKFRGGKRRELRELVLWGVRHSVEFFLLLCER